MKRQKFTHKKDLALKKSVIFCSECGEELESFGLEEKPDLEKIKARHKRCREIGKFKGDKCAMLFIADENETAISNDEVD